MTVEQFAQLETAEIEDFELVDGELISSPSATLAHALTRDRIVVAFYGYLAAKPVGRAAAEIDCRLSEAIVRRSDVAFFFTPPVRPVPMDVVPIPFAPDIAIEILSPSERAVEVNRKVLDYLAAGSREVWLFDRDNAEAFVHTEEGVRLVRGNQVLETALLAGFQLSLADLFAA